MKTACRRADDLGRHDPDHKAEKAFKFLNSNEIHARTRIPGPAETPRRGTAMKSEHKPIKTTHEASSTNPKMQPVPTLKEVENRFGSATAKVLKEMVAEIEASQCPPTDWTAGAVGDTEKRRLLSVVHRRLAAAALEIIEDGDALDLRPAVGDRLPHKLRADRLLDSLDDEQRPDLGKMRSLSIAMFRAAEIDVNAQCELADVAQTSCDVDSYSWTLFRLDAAVRQMRFAAAAASACDRSG
jgi:hypothetical protein